MYIIYLYACIPDAMLCAKKKSFFGCTRILYTIYVIRANRRNVRMDGRGRNRDKEREKEGGKR